MSMQPHTADLVTVRVHQMAIRSVWVERTVLLQMPSEFRNDQSRVEEFIRAGESDYGPFLWDPMDGSESLEVMDTAVGRETDDAPDVRATPQDDLINK
jgi:hypothetical protein